MRRIHGTTLLALGLACVSQLAAAQVESPPAPATAMTATAPTSPGCTDAAHREFDFWVGTWAVHGGPDGKQLQGHNRIERSANGCWLGEHWQDAGGGRGTSLNGWDAQYGVWRQFWVGARGNVLRLAGGLRDGSMVMEGELPGRDGGVQRQRITWTPRPDGSVSQAWDTSDDAGKTWQTGFLGIYRRVDTLPADTP